MQAKKSEHEKNLESCIQTNQVYVRRSHVQNRKEQLFMCNMLSEEQIAFQGV